MKVKGDADGSTRKRSEVVTVRLDPRLKYLAEIAARKQRRTLSGYIEWAVEQSLAQVVLRDGIGCDDNESVSSLELRYRLWDVDDSERVLKLAFHFPELLTYEEQLIWRLIRDCGYVWQGSYSGPGGGWDWNVDESKIIWDRVRENWDKFKQVADGRLPRDRLPLWEKYRKPKQSGSWSPPPDLDDEVPF